MLTKKTVYVDVDLLPIVYYSIIGTFVAVNMLEFPNRTWKSKLLPSVYYGRIGTLLAVNMLDFSQMLLLIRISTNRT